MRKTTIIFIFKLIALSLKAQMTLHDCLVYARDNAHSNIISRMDIDKAKLDRDISASSLKPYVGFYTNGNLSFGRNIDPETNTYDNRKTISTSFGISMSLPLFDGLVFFCTSECILL